MFVTFVIELTGSGPVLVGQQRPTVRSYVHSLQNISQASIISTPHCLWPHWPTATLVHWFLVTCLGKQTVIVTVTNVASCVKFVRNTHCSF